MRQSNAELRAANDSLREAAQANRDQFENYVLQIRVWHAFEEQVHYGDYSPETRGKMDQALNEALDNLQRTQTDYGASNALLARQYDDNLRQIEANNAELQRIGADTAARAGEAAGRFHSLRSETEPHSPYSERTRDRLSYHRGAN